MPATSITSFNSAVAAQARLLQFPVHSSGTTPVGTLPPPSSKAEGSSVLKGSKATTAMNSTSALTAAASLFQLSVSQHFSFAMPTLFPTKIIQHQPLPSMPASQLSSFTPVCAADLRHKSGEMAQQFSPPKLKLFTIEEILKK